MTTRRAELLGAALALGAAGMMAPTGARLAALPPPKKLRNPKREAQKAQRKARKTNRAK